MMEINSMNVHEQEDMMILGATIFGAMKNGAFVKDVLAVSFSSTNLLHKKDQMTFSNMSLYHNRI